MRSPAVPLNLSGIDSPVTEVTVTGGPPGEIESDVRALPVTLRVADVVPLLTVTEKVTAPPAVGVKLPVSTPSPRAVSATGAPFALAVTVTPLGSAQFAASAVNETGVPTSVRKPLPGESIHTCGVALHATALPMLSRPPLLVVVARAGFGSTVPSRSAFNPAALAEGNAAFARAAAPVTCGVAI